MLLCDTIQGVHIARMKDCAIAICCCIANAVMATAESDTACHFSLLIRESSERSARDGTAPVHANRMSLWDTMPGTTAL